MMTAEWICEIENNLYTTIEGLLSVFSIFKKNDNDREIVLVRINDCSYRYLLHVVDKEIKYIEEAENTEFFINHINKLNTWSEISAKDINPYLLDSLRNYLFDKLNREKIMSDTKWSAEIDDEYKKSIDQQDIEESNVCAGSAGESCKDNGYKAARTLGKLTNREKSKQI